MPIYYCTPKSWTEPWDFGQALAPNIKLGPSDTLVWVDMIYQSVLQKVIDTNGTPGKLISSAHVEQILENSTVVNWPHYLLKHGLRLWPHAKKFDDQPIQHCANFAINKKRINRYILIKLLEWYDIKNFDYTWSGIGRKFDLSPIFSQIDQLPVDLISDQSEFRGHLLSPITNIDTKFVYVHEEHVSNVSLEHGEYDWIWNNCHGPMVSGSAVTLITESLGDEKWSAFTEKTLYAIFGLTFPIWVGGYGSAQRWAEKGFDIFDDVINHDYQYCDGLLERCIRAIADNLQILTDLDHARQQKTQHLDRLRRNRELLIPIYKKQYEIFWQSAPVEIRAITAITDEINQLLVQNGFGSLDNK
jgi:hypothetical protein